MAIMLGIDTGLNVVAQNPQALMIVFCHLNYPLR
jgi:hypothetical protein